jgi:hypothetical protein
MEISPPQYPSFPFIPLIPKQALRGNPWTESRARKPRRAGQLTPGHSIARARHRAARCGREQRWGKVRKKGRGEADKLVLQVSEREVKGRGHRWVGLRLRLD